MKYSIALFLAFVSQASFGFYDLKSELQHQSAAQQISLSYNEARVKLFNVIDLKKDTNGAFFMDVYCAVKFYHYKAGETIGTKLPDPKFMNTEHTWPQSKFSKSFPENTQKTDLHHLYPAGSKINSERGNLPFAEVNSVGSISCQNSQRGKPISTNSGSFFEPPTEHKGNVARSMFYFSTRYKMPIDPVQEYFLRQWHILDPIDANEKARHEIISQIQNNRNPYIDDPGLVNQVLDF